MIKLGICWHEFDSIVKVLMGEVDLLKSKVSVTPVKESSCVVRVKRSCLVVLIQTFLVDLVVIESQGLVVEVGSFGSI